MRSIAKHKISTKKYCAIDRPKDAIDRVVQKSQTEATVSVKPDMRSIAREVTIDRPKSCNGHIRMQRS